MIYTLGFISAALTLVGWFYALRQPRLHPIFRLAFFASLVLFLTGILSADASWSYKWGILSRDLMMLGGIGLVFRALQIRPAAFMTGAALLVAGLFFWGNFQLRATFPQPEQPPKLDSSAELLLEIKAGESVEKIAALSDRYGLSLQPAFRPDKPETTDLDDYYLVDVPEGQTHRLKQILRALGQSTVVDWVEENELITLNPLPAKSPSPIQKRFGINDPGLEKLWGFEAMQVDHLYGFLRKNRIKPKKTALIAILDTGVDAKHEDLQSNYHSTQSKYDSDPRKHGTHCAGIAAAVTNNNLGIASFAPNAKFVKVTSIKVLSAMGSGTQAGIIKGMIEAADKGASVISMSLGGRSNHARQKAYGQAVEYANKAGAIVVAAAGNSNTNAKDFSPVNARGVIGVSAVDRELKRAMFSNYVTDLAMGVSAPGVDVYSTVPNDQYATFSGTSMAAPYVSGLIGLLKAIRPDLSTQEAHRILTTTGTDTQAVGETGKLINPQRAVEMLVNKEVREISR